MKKEIVIMQSCPTCEQKVPDCDTASHPKTCPGKPLDFTDCVKRVDADTVEMFQYVWNENEKVFMFRNGIKLAAAPFQIVVDRALYKCVSAPHLGIWTYKR